MASTAQVQVDTLNKFLEAWRTQEARKTIALWSEDFKQRLLPCSLGASVNSRAQAEGIYPLLTSSLSNWKVCHPRQISRKGGEEKKRVEEKKKTK